MAALVTDSGRKSPARFAGSAILASQSDERLVKLARSGHERAFDAIVARYRRQLIRFCARILPESRAEDAVQQAFINAHAALLASDEHVQLKPWLYAITRNAALNMLRQNGWNYEQIPLDFDGVRRPDQIFEQRIELQQTVAALNELPERQRDALVMREFEGRSYDEIAIALGTGDGAVRQLLNRARVTLRNAASLLTPPPLVARAAASMPPADGRRAAELFAGMGAAGMAKAGATALVAGTLVVGAVKAPLPLNDGKPTQPQASLAPAKTSDDTPSAHDTPIAVRPMTHVTPSKRGSGHAPVREHSGGGRSGRSGSGESEHRGSGESERSRERERSRSDDGGSRDRSGSGDSPTGGSGDRSGTSGGSDDGVTILSGSDDSSGTSGTSGSGTSGTSGSGDSLSATSGSSGSDDSTTSGTSGSSGSGSGETTTTTTTTSGSDSSGSSSGISGSSDSLEH